METNKICVTCQYWDICDGMCSNPYSEYFCEQVNPLEACPEWREEKQI